MFKIDTKVYFDLFYRLYLFKVLHDRDLQNDFAIHFAT